MKKHLVVIPGILLQLLSGCNSGKTTSTENQYKGLKDFYKDHFTMGVAVSPQALQTADEAALILRHYASLTAENAMKMEPIHPKENEYYWKDADAIVDFATRNKMKIRGHCLVWHNQAPDWMFKEADGRVVSKEKLLQRMKDHISAVVKRYKGKIYAWDVVNEVISDKANEYFRPSVWYQVCGEEFLEKAFTYAHEADPDALLFYNDYNEIDPAKRAKIIRMIKALQAKGIPIHGVGLQAHWAVNEPSEYQLRKTLKDFSELGLNMQITELDISVYPKEHEAREANALDYDTSFSPQKEAQQIKVYEMCFRLFREYKKNISAVTFWNVSERYSWLDNFPVKNRKDYPLLFDKFLQKKKVYEVITAF